MPCLPRRSIIPMRAYRSRTVHPPRRGAYVAPRLTAAAGAAASGSDTDGDDPQSPTMAARIPSHQPSPPSDTSQSGDEPDEFDAMQVQLIQSQLSQGLVHDVHVSCHRTYVRSCVVRSSVRPCTRACVPRRPPSRTSPRFDVSRERTCGAC